MRLIFAGVLLAIAPAAASAQESSAYVVRLGTDTLSFEEVTRTPHQIRGESVTRTPRPTDRTYVVDLAPDGTARRFELVTRNLTPGPGPVETRATIVLAGDSAVATSPRGDSTVTSRYAGAKGAAPLLTGIMGLLEHVGRRARAAGGAGVALPIVSPSGTQAFRGTVTRAGGDTMVLIVDTGTGRVGPYSFGLDKAGQLAWFSGHGSTYQAEGRRVPAVNLAATRAAFAAHPLGQLSARDTARARVGDAELWVDYGRPSKRGRDIFGNVVPWNSVWRTGANAATQLHTSADLVIGGADVPAGTYTLWTLPTPNGWKLIINKQTGQWGTDYHADQDLIRVDLRVETLPEPVERLTIAIEPDGAGATLGMAWDRTRASVPIKKKS
jgi:hypothetical protein